MKRIVTTIGLFIGLSVAYIAVTFTNTPDITEVTPNAAIYEEFSNSSSVSINYYGTSTLLFDDGETQVMTDGFFSRPSISELLFKPISPNVSLLKRIAKQEKLGQLAVIIPVHSHHDHAMDSAPLAQITGATVLGSQTTAYIAEGWGLPYQQITIAKNNQTYQYGNFSITLIPSKHIDMPKFLASRIGMGEQLVEPLKHPASLKDYKEGTSYSVVIQHPKGSFLVQGSANYIPQALVNIEVDTVFLGIAGLGGKTDRYLDDYLEETVLAVKAKKVIPIHWESFTKPASNKVLATAIDDIGGTIQRIEHILDSKNISVSILPVKVINQQSSL